MANGGLITDYLAVAAGAPSAYAFPGGSTGVPSLGVNATETARYFNTTNSHEYAWTGSAWVDVTGTAGAAGAFSAYLLFQERQVSGTAGGTFTSGSDVTRVLNTKVADTGSFGSVSSNQITLAAGTYKANLSAPGNGVGGHQCFLYNVTDAVELFRGGAEYSGVGGSGIQSRSEGWGWFTIAASKALELRHRCNSTSVTNGLGYAAAFGPEVYSTVELYKV